MDVRGSPWISMENLSYFNRTELESGKADFSDSEIYCETHNLKALKVYPSSRRGVRIETR